MISLKRYLDLPSGTTMGTIDEAGSPDLVNVAMEEYGATMAAVGNCCAEACPMTVDTLRHELEEIRSGLSVSMEPEKLQEAGNRARAQLHDWGRATAKHYQEKAAEVKELLLAMARTTESVSERDARVAGHMNEVTDRLRAIASLEDLAQIRVSISRSARELKSSIDRMAAEGKAALDAMRQQVLTYQVKLDAAEAIASRDSLTGLSNRMCVEGQIDRRIATGGPFTVALIDIDGFKSVNDRHGHPAGDELLRQFAVELRSACRATDVIGRWGGDEFILIFDCGLAESQTRTDRLRERVCGKYRFDGRKGEITVHVEISIGLAEHAANETMSELVERADAAMYANKESARRARTGMQPAAV